METAGSELFLDEYSSLCKKIRVLHVAEPAGGVDIYLKTLFRYSDPSKVENILVCSQNYDTRDYRDVTDAVEQIHMEHEVSALDDGRSVRMIRELIERYSPDIVYAHSSKAGALLRMADIGIRNRVLYNPHGWSFNMRIDQKSRRKYAMIERAQSPFTDRIICISDSEKRSALRHRICNEKKLSVIYNGVDLNALRNVHPESREHLGIPNNAFVVGMCGRISEQKDPTDFVKAAKVIKLKIPEAFFIIVGDGPERKLIESQIKRYELSDSFLITGWVKDAWPYMSLFDVGMLLSKWEGFGLVIPEMMYLRIPVIATAIDGIRDIITGGTDGILVNPSDPAFAAAKAVVSIHDDTSFSEHLRINAHRTAALRFDGKRMAEETEVLYEEVMWG